MPSIRHNGAVSEAKSPTSRIAQIMWIIAGVVLFVVVEASVNSYVSKESIVASLVWAVVLVVFLVLRPHWAKPRDPDEELAESHYASKDVYSAPPLRSVTESARADGVLRRSR